MSYIKFLTILFICLFTIRCDTLLGRCKDVEYELDSFDLNRYLGNWYEVARAKSIPFQSGDCTQANYSLNDDGSIKVNNTDIIHGVQKSGIGRAEITENPFRLKLRFPGTFWGKIITGDYQIVDTDYDNYTIVYSCSSYIFAKVELYWILSRTREVSSDRILELTNYVAKKFNKTPNDFRVTDQSDKTCGGTEI